MDVWFSRRNKAAFPNFSSVLWMEKYSRLFLSETSVFKLLQGSVDSVLY